MYVEELRTPHRLLLESDEEADEFLAAAGAAEAAQYISDAPDQDAAKQNVIDHVQSIVRRTLRYPEAGDGSRTIEGTTFDTLRALQITNCMGYTAVGSECLDQSEIEHYTGYANGHWFLLVPYAEGEKLEMRDFLSPKFNQDIVPSLVRGAPEQLMEQANSESGRGTAMLNTVTLTAAIGSQVDELEVQHPWLTVAKDSAHQGDDFSLESVRNRYINEHTLVLSVFTPQNGRLIMEHYAAFRRAVTISDLSAAFESLRRIRGLYPEIDARTPHNEIRRFVNDLCVSGKFDQATEAVESYCQSFTPSKDARLKGLEGDLLRRIGATSRDPSLARRSQDAYEAALERTHCGGHSSEKYLGKIAAVSSLVDEMHKP